MEQRSDEWFAARLGKLTASRIADATATTKTGWGASRAAYRAELVVERLTGEPFPSYTSAAMQRGIDMEPAARLAYSFRTGNELEDGPGFIDHPTIGMSGASPDACVVGTSGLIEVKCPLAHTHLDYLMNHKPPAHYVKQMQWQMACTECDWVDWISYCPMFPESMTLLIIRIERDNAFIAQLEEQAEEFLEEVSSAVASLQRYYG